MKDKAQKNKFKDSFIIRKFPIIIAMILILALGIFFVMYNNYKEVLIIDLDGYMISNENVSSLKSDSEEETAAVETVKVKSYDSIYKNSLNHYVDNEKKNSVNIDYPLYANNGLTIINYNENTNLLDTNFERTTGFKNLVISYGKLYDITDYTQLDQESYLFLAYEDGVFINLYDVKIETLSNTYNIPINSFMYFSEDRINYYERTDDGFIRKTIRDTDYESKVTFYYNGEQEEYKYTYEEVAVGTGSVYIEEEEPNEEVIIFEEPVVEEPEEEEVVEEPEDEKPEKPKVTWKKPNVKVGDVTANVYSIQSSIVINDPYSTITKAPTFTLYIDGKVSTRRTYYGSGEFIISGLSADTEYYIVGQYTYLDEDGETKKVATFYSNSVKTLGREALEKISMSYELGDIYARKVELKNIQITSSLTSESLRGVKKASLITNGVAHNISTTKVQKLIKGETVNVESNESLVSNNTVDFEIRLYDKEGNILETIGNTGTTRTSKKEPSVFLKTLDSDNINVKISVDLRNDDNVALNNYHYTVTNEAGVVVTSGEVTGTRIEILDLDPNQVFDVKVMADIDLNDGKGVRKDFELGSMSVTTLPISSLGYVNLKVSTSNVTSTSAELNVEINSNKTDKILITLLDKITIFIYDAETNDLLITKYIEGMELANLQNGKIQTIELGNLTSNQNYKLEFRSLVSQGTTEYDLDCIYNLNSFSTRKIPAQVYVTNSFTSSSMIDFDVMVTDIDGAIISQNVVVELRDEKKNIVKTQLIDVNTDDFIRITYNNLTAYHNYTVYFYANEYNETNDSSEYHSKYELKSMEILTEEGISGKIELVSSLKKENGRNLVDVNSEVKWIQTQNYYTIPKEVDEEGDMHIYSKTGAASYTYDLSDYHGQMVTATFKIKAVNPVYESYSVYFANYISGTTNTSYGMELTGISSTTWKTFTYTFKVGYYYNASSQKYYPVTSYSYGENVSDYAGFYINGGTATLAEYEIRDLEMYVSEEQVTYTPNITFESGGYNSNKTKYISTTRVRIQNGITLEGGYYYEFNFNVYYALFYFYYSDGSTYWKGDGWTISGQTFYVPSDAIVYISFQHQDPTQVLSPQDVSFEIRKLKKVTAAGYQTYKSDLLTQVRVNLTDLRNEITKRDYYIKIYENSQEVKSYNYIELQGITKLEGVIKEIELAENKNYVIELGIMIRDRYYSLSSFELSTKTEVRGISNTNDWSLIQPKGTYIAINDISFEGYTSQIIGYGYRYFYGTIDFQGYTMEMHTDLINENFTRIGRIEKSGVIKNLVLDIYYDREAATVSNVSFVNQNYGTIENVHVNVYDIEKGSYENQYRSTICTQNEKTGVIRNFSVNIATNAKLYYYSSVFVRTNYGTIENGYIYGNDVKVEPEYGDNCRISLLQYYGGARSTVNKVFVLSNLKFSGDSACKAGLISYETYGSVTNSYVAGSANNSLLSNGPAVGIVQSTATLSKVYYYNDNVHLNDYHQKINATALNDVYFQEELLGDNFVVEEMVEMGYYPQVVYSSEKMPTQEYISLPSITNDNLVDIVSSEVVEQTNSTAIIDFNVSNPYGDEITQIAIADVDVTILSQSYADGKSKVQVKISNPDTYQSKYQIRSISSSNFLGYTSKRSYSAGEKYLEVSFYKEISTMSDWEKINNGLDQNYILMNDLDFYGYSNYYINNFSGVLNGNGYTIKNVDIIKSGKAGIFNQMNGTLIDINFENIYKNTNSSYGGIVGYSNQYGRYENVHITNMRIELPTSKTSDTVYYGALVGYGYTSRIENCSVTGITITSDVNVGGIAIGGLVGYSSNMSINNSYVQDVDISVTNAMNIQGVGGLVGRQAGSYSIINNCYTTGKVYNSNVYTAGIAGRSGGTIETSYSSVDVTSDLNYASGISGYTDVDKTYINNNLYVGNIYSSKEVTGRITSNIEVNETNFGLTTSLINGSVSDITYGEGLVTPTDLTNDVTYTETIALGDNYDYSKSSSEILPKVYYADTEELLPNQKDNQLYKDLFSIENSVITKHTDSATIVLYLKNEEEYIVTDIQINDVKVEINKNTNENGYTVIELEGYPEKYFDNYQLTKIYYKESADSEEVKEFDKKYKLEMTFYKYIRNYDDWQTISKTDAENYLLMADIDFTGRQNINLNVVFNRLETTSDSETHTLKGITLNVTTNSSYNCVIQNVMSSIKNINFEDITINDTTTGTNNYSNVIMNNYGDMNNITFKDITLSSPYENYVGVIGKNYSYNVTNVTLDTIDVSGREYVGGFIAYAENGEGRIYDTITATNITVNGTRNYVGGVFGYMPTTNSLREYYVTNINLTDASVIGGLSYVGGIAGIGEASESTATNIYVKGDIYVGGITGYQRSNYMTGAYLYDSTVEVTGYYGAGIAGYGRYLYDSHVYNSTIETIEADAYAIGGITGYENGYHIKRCGITNTTVTGIGSRHGGITGYQTSGDSIGNYVQDSIINGPDEVGGLIGRFVYGWDYYNSVTRTLVNATNSYAGGIVGKIDNTEYRNGYIREVEVTDTDIISKYYAGGFFGGMNYPLYSETYIYGLYFEGSVSSENDMMGLGSGDGNNAQVINLSRVYAYEKALVNGEKLESIAAEKTTSNNLIIASDFVNGYYLNDKNEVTSYYNYPTAAYTNNYITLTAGKTYTLGVKKISGSDWMRMNVYDEDGNFISDSNSSSVNYYFGRQYYLGGQTEVTFRVINDCKVKISFYNLSDLSSYYLKEVVTGPGGLLTSQLLSYEQLRHQTTWTRYFEGKKVDYYHSTKLNYTYDNFNFTPLNNTMNNYTIPDLSGNNHTGTGTLSGKSEDGARFDYDEDTITVSNYTAPKEFTISALYTSYSSHGASYQFLFASEDFNYSNNGIGLFIHGRQVYARINGSNYSTSYYLPYNTTAEVTITYENNKTLKFYVNGELIKTTTVNKTVNVLSSATTAISPGYVYSGTTYRVSGSIGYVKVYERALTQSEVLTDYKNQTITDQTGLQLYYDFFDLDYQSEVGYYPIVEGNEADFATKNQIYTELPTDDNRDYTSTTLTTTTTYSSAQYQTSLVNDSLSNIYNVYSSGVNTVNLEFDNVYSDLSFSYKNGEYQSEEINVTQRIYTLSYDYADDLEITLKSVSEQKTFTFTKDDLVHLINIIDSNYYHIDNNILYKNGEELVKDAKHIYNNLVLLTNNQIYNIETNTLTTPLLQEGITYNAIALAEYQLDGSIIKTYYNYTEVISSDGTSATRDGQIYIKDGTVYVFDNDSSTKQEMNIYNTYNTDEYQISLTDNQLISIKNNIKFPSYFSNNNIVEVKQDLNNDNPIIIVRYENGYIYAFDYYNGEELYTYGEKQQVTLFKFIFNTFSGNYSLSSSNDSYSESKDLKSSLENVTDEEVKGKLVTTTEQPEQTDDDVAYVETDNSAESKTNKNELSKGYIQVYNYDTDSYEVYSTEDLLNADKENVESENTKIKNDTFLYNYFYGNKINQLLSGGKIFIYIAIIALVLVNLGLLIKYLSNKEVKKRGQN